MRQDCPAQLGWIFTDAAQQVWKRHSRLKLPCEGFQFEPRRKRIAGDFLVVVAGASGINQQVACGMLDEDASGRRAEGTVAERFRRLHPARGNAGDDGNYWNSSRMRRSRR